MIKMITYSILLSFIFTECCSQKKMNKVSSTVKQGITGKVFEVSGNQMPSPDLPQQKNEGSPLSTTIVFFPLQKHENLQHRNGIYTNIESSAIAEVISNKQGEFTIALPVGVYSVFIKLKEGYYANSFDEKMNVNPVTIKKDSLTSMKIKFDLNAAY